MTKKLEMGSLSWIIWCVCVGGRGSNVIESPYKGKRKAGESQREGDETTEAEVGAKL